MDIRKIMQIARIHLEEDQIPVAQNKLDVMYSWLESIKKVDVSGFEPIYSIHESETRTVREVENPELYQSSLILKNTPVKSDDFILVPKVIGGE